MGRARPPTTADAPEDYNRNRSRMAGCVRAHVRALGFASNGRARTTSAKAIGCRAQDTWDKFLCFDSAHRAPGIITARGYYACSIGRRGRRCVL